jgi:hypothetical protein
VEWLLILVDLDWLVCIVQYRFAQNFVVLVHLTRTYLVHDKLTVLQKKIIRVRLVQFFIDILEQYLAGHRRRCPNQAILVSWKSDKLLLASCA